MAQSADRNQDIARRGEELYEQQIRAQIGPGNEGKYLVIDVNTGHFELDENDLAATKRALARRPNPTLYIMRIGYPAATRLGGGFRFDGAAASNPEGW